MLVAQKIDKEDFIEKIKVKTYIWDDTRLAREEKVLPIRIFFFINLECF